jgi:hypothetical protein
MPLDQVLRFESREGALDGSLMPAALMRDRRDSKEGEPRPVRVVRDHAENASLRFG